MSPLSWHRKSFGKEKMQHLQVGTSYMLGFAVYVMNIHINHKAYLHPSGFWDFKGTQAGILKPDLTIK